MGTTNNIDALKYADESLRSDSEFMLSMIKLDAKAFEYAIEDLKLDKKFVTEAIKNNKKVFNHISDSFKSDPEFMFNVIVSKVDIDENAYEYDAYVDSSTFGNRNKHIRRYSGRNYYVDVEMLDFLSDDLKSNENFMLKLIKINSQVANHLHEGLITKHEFISYIDKDWEIDDDLSIAPLDIQDNKDAVIKIVGKYGRELEYASDRLKSDKEVVISAVLSSPASIKYADHKLQGDSDVILEALNKLNNGFYEETDGEFYEADVIMKYVPYSLVSDKEFMLKAIKIYPDSYRYASTNLMNDKDFILDAVRSNSDVLEFLDSELRSDKEIIMTAVQGIDTDSKWTDV